ncbi:MAG: hypothetical protein AB8B94_19010 [Hyphomicrobiales bacterium]
MYPKLVYDHHAKALAAFLLEKAVHPFLVHEDALTLQHHENTPVAKTTPLCSDLVHRFAQMRIIRANALIADTRAINLMHVTRPSLAHSVLLVQVNHCLSSSGGRYRFFEFTTFSIALSSICSASNFFNLAFSSSSALSLRASEISTLGHASHSLPRNAFR